MYKFYLAAFFIFFYISAFAQTQEMKESWSRTAGGFGEDGGASVAVDHHGGVYIAGSFRSPLFTIGTATLTNTGGSDIFIAKYDTAGNFLWHSVMAALEMKVSDECVYLWMAQSISLIHLVRL